MDDNEFLEALALLRAQGWQAEACTEHVPVMTESVVCGKPLPLSDAGVEEFMALPQRVAHDVEGFILRVRGDSMEPRYHEGDLVIVERAERADDGQNVVALVDGECTLKTFIHDRRQCPWLVPLNRSKYRPIRITDKTELIIIGIVRGHINLDEHESPASALDAIDAYEREQRNAGSTAASRPQAAALRGIMSDATLADERIGKLDRLIRGQKGKRVALVVSCAMELGWFVEQPSFNALIAEFGNLGNISGYNRQIKVARFAPTAEKEPIIEFLKA